MKGTKGYQGTDVGRLIMIRCETMRGIRLRLTFLAAILMSALCIAFCAPHANAANLPSGAVKAKMSYCEVCHGASGRGFVGYFPVPRLAGQQVAYIENELKGFIEHKRNNAASPEKTNVMFNVGHVLTPEMIEALAQNFHALDPKPLGGAPKALVPAGRKIFKDGIPSTRVPACASCHGPDAKGQGAIPRLAGQIYPYVVSQLMNWGNERAEHNSKIMAPIAHSLTKSQIRAVAAYVSYLN